MKTVYYHGEVYTGTLPLSEAFVVEDGRFLYAGSNKAADAMAEEGDGKVDLEGHFVCSGFNDSHMHLIGLGKMLGEACLANRTDSLEDMLRCLKEFLEEHPVKKGKWLVGRGWNQDYFDGEQRMPDRYDLDQVSKEIPICAIRACGHCLVVNSQGLKMAGVTEETLQPEGGYIGRADGVPDGRFYDNAMALVYDAIPAPDKEGIKDMIRRACKALNGYGITSSQSDDYRVFNHTSWQVIHEAFRELEESKELTVRVCEQSHFDSLNGLKEFVEQGYRTGGGTDMFRTGPLKLMADGSLGSRTAYLTRPYADDRSTCGIPLFSQEAMDEIIGYAHTHGMQAAVHAIGDAGLDLVLHAYEKALTENPETDHRHGIVHCQITRTDQLKKIKELNLHVYAQSIFLDYDIHMVEKRVGKELASTSYSWKTLMKNGVSVSNGSDCPVELPDVMAGIQCAVTRRTLRDHIGPYLPEECFTVQEALDSFTFHSAEASFEETKKGRIQAGMFADFVILGRNPFKTDYDKIKDIPILATYLGGRAVFDERFEQEAVNSRRNRKNVKSLGCSHKKSNV